MVMLEKCFLAMTRVRRSHLCFFAPLLFSSVFLFTDSNHVISGIFALSVRPYLNWAGQIETSLIYDARSESKLQSAYFVPVNLVSLSFFAIN